MKQQQYIYTHGYKFYILIYNIVSLKINVVSLIYVPVTKTGDDEWSKLSRRKSEKKVLS